jgi:glutamate-1-semialdehyde 2,1-aminomutase
MSDSVRLDRGFPNITASNQIFERARGLIPAGTQTLSKGPQQYVRGVAPKYLQRGKGARVWDVDGNEYIDLTMAVGPLVLGYGYPAVDEAVRAQLEEGVVFSLMHPLEVEVAELIRDLVPCAEMVRYSKSGADVCSAAIRVARAVTGRSKVLCCGYHGWTTGTSRSPTERPESRPWPASSPTPSTTTTSRVWPRPSTTRPRA